MTNPDESQSCGYCKTLVYQADGECTACGYPQFGQKKDKLNYIETLNEAKNEYERIQLEVDRMSFFFNFFGIIGLLSAGAALIVDTNDWFHALAYAGIGVLFLGLQILRMAGKIHSLYAMLVPSLTVLAITVFMTLKYQLLENKFLIRVVVAGGFLSALGLYLSYCLFRMEKIKRILFRNPAVRRKMEHSLKKRRNRGTGNYVDE